MWREASMRERNWKIWKEELEEFVPDKVLDFHVHVFDTATLPSGESYSCGGHPIRQYSFEDLARDLAEVYPGRDTYAVCFGMPIPTYKIRQNDAYIARGCDRAGRYGLRLFNPHADTPESLERALVEGNFVGIKPYPDFAGLPDVNDATIPEMLPDWAMAVVNRLSHIVMLHIPRRARLADPLNQDHIVDLCTRYPRAKIVLAHMGRSYYLKGIVQQLERLKDLPNLYVDLAMVQHWEVMEYGFHHLGHDKLLYGTDIPIALAPGKAVEINDQYTYVTPVPWSLSISDEHRKLVFTSFLYEELRAVKRAVARSGLSRDFVRALFYGNGMRLLSEAAGAGGNS